MDTKPLRFISEPIQVQFEKPPTMEKKPGCPDRFIWRDETYQIINKLGEWFDYSRRGHMAYNMTPNHAATAELRGSWGVGRFYFRVQTSDERIFDLYYDRAPKNVDNRKGGWYLFRELSLKE
ncbi:MAG: DUF6504 family protein [Anaerolineales bacterium]|jgi:hypothetical protein